MLFTVVRFAAKHAISATAGYFVGEIGLGEMFESCVHELREVDLAAIEAKASETIHSADNVVNRLVDGTLHVAAHLPNPATATPP